MEHIDEKLQNILAKTDPFFEQLVKENNELKETNISVIIAGLIDLGEGFYKIYYQLLSRLLCKNNKVQEQADILFDIEDELINHLLPHINSMKEELHNVISILDKK